MKAFLRHPATITALVFIVLVSLFFLLLPLGTKLYLTHWLTKNGADTASIEKLSINPFTGKLTLNGVLVQIGDNEPIKHDRLIVDLGIKSLLKKDVLIEQVTYQDAHFELEQYADGTWRYGSYTYKSSPTTTTSADEIAEEQASSTATPWAFSAGSVELDNCTVHLKTPALDFTVTVDHAQLDRITTRSGEPDGSLSLSGSINGNPVSLDFSTLHISPDLFLEGNAKIDGFELDNLQSLLQAIFPTFTGSAGIDGYVSFLLDRKGYMLINYDGAITGDNIDMRSEPYSNTISKIEWQGTAEFSQGDGKPISIKTDGSLVGDTISVQVPSAELQLENLELKKNGTTDLVIDESVKVDTDGELTLANAQVNIRDMDFSEDSINWQGKISYSSGSEKPISIETDGTLVGKAIGMEIPTSQLTIPSLDLTLSGTTKLIVDELVSVDSDGTLDLNLPALELGKLSTTEGTFNWQGKLHWDSENIANLAIDGDAGSSLNSLELMGESPVSVGFEELTIANFKGTGLSTYSAGTISANTVGLSVAGKMPLTLKVQKVELGSAQLSDLKNFSANAISVSQFNAIPTGTAGKLASFDLLRLGNVSASTAPTFDTDSIKLTNSSYLPADEKGGHDFIKLATLLADSVHYDAENLTGNTIKLSDLLVDIRRNKDGAMEFSKRMSAMQPGTPASASTSEPSPENNKSKQQGSDSTPMHLQFASISVDGKSAVLFQDQSLTTPYSTKLDIKSLQITKLDSSKKDKQLELQLKGAFEKVAPLTISGTAAPFKDKPDTDFDISLKNYPLKSLSPYTIETVGTALSSGDLRVKSTLNLKGENIDLQNDVRLEKIETSTVKPELAAQLDKKLPVPLDAALAMLSDNDGNINLQIPVQGKLNDLDIGIGDIVVTALSKSIVSAASSYFLYALGPYGALAYVGMKVGENLLEVKLPAVTFTPGSSELDSKQEDYLGRIAKILQDRPETDLYITPQVSPWELYGKKEIKQYEGQDAKVELDEEMRKRLMDLAEKRVSSIKAYLLKGKTIPEERILREEVNIELKKDSKLGTTLEIK